MRYSLLPMGLLQLLKDGSTSRGGCSLGKLLLLLLLDRMQCKLLACIAWVLVWGWDASGWPLIGQAEVPAPLLMRAEAGHSLHVWSVAA